MCGHPKSSPVSWGHNQWNDNCQTQVHITCVAFSEQRELLASYNDELIYLFQQGMGLGPSPPKQQDDEELDPNKPAPQSYKGHRNAKTVKGVSFFGPKSEYVVSGSDCGHIYIWKKRGGELVAMRHGDVQVSLADHADLTVPNLVTP